MSGSEQKDAGQQGQGTKPKELTAAQLKAIPHVLASRNLEDAAKAAGVSVRTLYRWDRDPVYRTAVIAQEGIAIDYATRRLVVLADRALDTLQAVLDDKTASANVRVRAALGVLDSMTSLRELRNLEARLTALEQLYYAQAVGVLDGNTKPSRY